MRLYNINDINVISQVQTVALNTALPIVLTIFKHFFEESTKDEKTEWKEIKHLTNEEIKKKVKEDSYLLENQYPVSNEFIENAVSHLIDKKFLEILDDKIFLTDMGRTATKLLLDIEQKS